MQIISSEYLISSPGYLQCPKADRPEYAFIGRSNVGKSSLINMICNKQNLAKTSGAPGKTKLINHFSIESIPVQNTVEKKQVADHWYIVDLPGYGFAKVSITERKKWEKMIEDYLRKRTNLVNVFVLVDSRHDPQKLDLEFVNSLGKWGVPFCIVFTKADKETQRMVSLHVKAFFNKMRDNWQFLPQYVVTSTVKKLGREKILGMMQAMNEEFKNGDKPGEE